MHLSAFVVLLISPFSLFSSIPPHPAPQTQHHACAVKQPTPSAKHHSPASFAPLPHQVGPVRKGELPCSRSDWAELEPAAAAAAIATADDSCLYPLWTFDNDLLAAAAPARITAVLDLIETHTADLSNRSAEIQKLLYFLQIGFYHEWYQAALEYDDTLTARAGQVVAAVGLQPGFIAESSALTNLRYQWSITIDSTNGSVRCHDVLFQLIDRFHRNPELASDWYERSAAFNLFFTLSRQITMAAGPNSPWNNLITAEQLALVEAVATTTTYNENTEAFINNAIYALGNFSNLDETTATAAHAAITNAYQTQARYSGPWFRALQDIDTYYNGRLGDGTQLDMDAVRAEAKNFALPNRFVYDDGRLIFETAVSRAQADALYDAMQEVEAQFFRKTTFLDPTPGDPNDILTLVIYGSPADYQTFQPFLNNLSTDNGGIYIESWSTLFTYDRTPADSYLSLEELLRHEYVHYLDGRYVVVPSFGEGDMYQSSRLDWYAEGLAEFLAGSRRTDGVLPRRIYVDIISRDEERMTVAQIVNASYSGGWKFYRYGGLLYNYLDEHQPALMMDLFNRVRGNDATEVDALYSAMAADSALQQGYSEYLDRMVAGLTDNSVVFAEDIPTSRVPADLPYGNETQLETFLSSNLPGAYQSFTTWPGRYQAVFELTVAASGTESAQRRALATQLDTYLGNIEDQGPNYRIAAAWFGNLTQVENEVRATCLIEGPYLSLDQAPAPTITPRVAAQGLNRLNFSAQVANVAGWSWDWRLLPDEVPMGGGQTDMTFDIFTETTRIAVAVSDTETEVRRAEALVLVADDSRFSDLNGDGCNTAADLRFALSAWRGTDLDADGDQRTTVLDLFYINTDLENCR
ncbi:collagenase [Acanthopleuribacter pedis]|uniref:microbial collagenase n=1 Tax=Acanthopleuribacter pedis TaxID=442870 RepID=A0A8J7QE19_9BACT|nr:collagenase [Acanthopleuribacter pedis]MBO1317393.1 collagenase [Acanthopleuribacter pedis]